MRVARASLCVMVLLVGCDPAAREPHAAEPPKPAPPVAEQPATETEPEQPAIEVTTREPSEPVEPPFDTATATSARVRVVTVHRDGTWTACGVIHSTGAIEVEVLDVGEPGPRMILIISCPIDFGHRQLLVVGKVLEVELFARRQRWPTPAIDRKLPPELPRRYVDKMKAIAQSGVAPG